VAEGHGASIGGDGMAAANGDVAVGDEWSAFALAAESKRLQLTNDLERERIVEFQHIDVGMPQSRVAQRAFRRTSTHHAVHVVAIAAPADEVPRGWMLIRRAVKVRAAAQYVDRLASAVGFGQDLLQVRYHQRAPALRSGRAIEQMKRLGDRP